MKPSGTNISKGAVRRMRTRLSMAIICWYYAAQSCCHLTRAASRWTLYVSLEFKCRSLLKWLKIDEWIETNFCKLRIRLKRSIARSLRRNGKWEFLALLLSQPPVSWRAALPMIFIAAPQDRSLAVTIAFVSPWCFIDFLRNFNAALRLRRSVT